MAQKRLVDRIKDDLAKEGLVARTTAARKWLQQKVRDIKLPGAAKEGFVNLSNKSRSRITPAYYIGRMFFYFYDPKTKDKLPYYDVFPLVIPISPYKDGFLGLNLHYIHPRHRIVLLDKLSGIMNNNRYDETTRLSISYGYLKSYSRAYEATPCIKRYLYSHITSRFLEVTADEWDICALLPFEDFKKNSKQQVWNKSQKKYRK